MSHYRIPPIAATATLLLFLLTPDVSPAQSRKASLKEMTETSHAIFTGKCVKKECSWNANRTKIFTQVRIQTDQLIKGDPGKEAVLTMPGGQVGTTVYEVSDMPIFREGEEVLVFLWKHPSGKNLVTGAIQGKLTLTEEYGTGRKIIQGGQILREGAGGAPPQPLQKAGPAPAAEGKVYLEDLKSDIQQYVK